MIRVDVSTYFTDNWIIGGGDFVKDTVNPLKSSLIFHGYAVILFVIKLKFTTCQSESYSYKMA